MGAQIQSYANAYTYNYIIIVCVRACARVCVIMQRYLCVPVRASIDNVSV